MNRSPLFYPLNRGMDADAGGAADLQTDVMRFMAIISLCLVAIFALVQSIPLTPVVESVPEPAAEPVAELPPAPEPDVQEEPIVLTRPEVAKPTPKPEPVVLERPRPLPPSQRTTVRPAEAASPADAVQPKATASTDSAPAPVSAPEDVQKGFTLRFESDRALTRLVEQDVVGLYAISDNQTLRMDVTGSQYSFWSASAPARYHEMDAGTVPETVMAAFRRRNSSPVAARWGVSLPANMSRSLNEYLETHEGGALVIGLDGQLRMEQ